MRRGPNQETSCKKLLSLLPGMMVIPNLVTVSVLQKLATRFQPVFHVLLEMLQVQLLNSYFLLCNWISRTYSYICEDFRVQGFPVCNAHLSGKAAATAPGSRKCTIAEDPSYGLLYVVSIEAESLLGILLLLPPTNCCLTALIKSAKP